MPIKFSDVVKNAIANSGGSPAGAGSYPKSGKGGMGGTTALANRARGQLADALPRGATSGIGNAMRATASNIDSDTGSRMLKALPYMRDSIESPTYDEGYLQNFAADANKQYGMYSSAEPWPSDTNSMYDDWQRRNLAGLVGDLLSQNKKQNAATNLIRSASNTADNEAMLSLLGTLQSPKGGRGIVKGSR